MIQDLDIYCLRDYYLSHNNFSKKQIQDLTTKESQPKNSKLKESKLADRNFSTLAYTNEPAKPNCKDKNRKWLKKFFLFQRQKIILLKVRKNKHPVIPVK